MFSLFFKANLLFTTSLFLSFLIYFKGYQVENLLFGIIATISTATLLSIIFYITSLPFIWIGNWRLKLLSTLFILANISLVIDFFIYKLFHFHINAMVLNILTSPDAIDSIQVGRTPFIILILIALGFIYFELYIYKTIQSFHKSKQRKLNKILNKFIILPFFIIVITDKLGFGFASLFSKNNLIAPVKVIPLYQPLTFTKIADKYFGFKAKEQAKYSIQPNAALNYPLTPLKIDYTKNTFPIFIIALDSVKYTAIQTGLTPNIVSFSKDCINLKHHFSGGNSTRFGIFSLIYGLNATYWFSFLNANQKPVLFDVLKQRGYDINIFSSTNTNWPEFRKTCYVAIQNKIQDNFKGKPWEKDAQSTQCFIDKINQYNNMKPQFNFIFLDAPHGYSYPSDSNLYHAPEGEVNYLKITIDGEELKTVKKRYKNALHYNDLLVGKMLQILKVKGLYEKSLIIFTSDHGQEFFEYGNFGHNTSFSLSQIHVPMMIKLPKALQSRKAPKSMTSHQDIVPTLLSLLGVKNPSNEYSNGQNIFESNYRRDYTFSTNWNNNAIITPSTISVFSNIPKNIFGNTVYDTQSYKKLSNAKPNSKFILDTMNENKKFLK